MSIEKYLRTDITTDYTDLKQRQTKDAQQALQLIKDQTEFKRLSKEVDEQLHTLRERQDNLIAERKNAKTKQEKEAVSQKSGRLKKDLGNAYETSEYLTELCDQPRFFKPVLKQNKLPLGTVNQKIQTYNIATRNIDIQNAISTYNNTTEQIHLRNKQKRDLKKTLLQDLQSKRYK